MSRAHGLDDDEEKGLLVDPSLAETEAGDGVLLALSPSRSDSTPAGDDDDDDCHPLQVSSPTTIDAPILPESACEQPEDPPRNTAAAAAASSDTQLVAAPDRPPPTAADPLHQQLSEQETIGIIMTTMEKEDATDGLANQQQQSRVISTSSTSLETEPVRTDADPGHSGGVPLSLSSLDGKNGGVDKISPPPAVGGRSSSLPLLALHPPQQSPGCVNYRRGDTTILPPDGGGNSSSNSIRSSVFVSKLSRRMRFSVVSNSNQTRRSFESASNITHRVGGQPDRELLSNRRYRVGDSVLVSILGGNHNNNNADFATKGVNQYGFPAGQGETSEECAGPYNFTLATVQQVHFEEIHPYYTVTRCDNGTDQRANADAMAPIPTEKGEIAAKRASGEMNSVRFASQHHEDNDEANHHVLNDRSVNVPRGMVAWCETACYFMAMPFLWLDDLIFYTWSKYMAPTVGSCMSFCRAQSRLLLNGLEPYSCRLRLTAVNVVVICSFAFMFIDHIRLAFLSPSSDDAIAILSLVLWGVLLFELFIEVFIRPSGYQELIMSDKAYAPTTVRYINFLHFFVESLSLAIFVPEFSCLFTGESCSMRIPFSFYNALLMSVIGPTRWHIVYGFFLIALYRLRIIGLVRHWRNMWITRTFINMTWYSTQKGILSNIIPPSIKSRRRSLPGKIVQDDDKKLLEKGRKLKDSALTNASTIGTALMATNSYRALAIVWVVIGLFPVVISLVGNKKNDVARIMTAQLQETNLIASDTSNETCKFLSASVASWLIGISYRHYLEKVPFLLSLDLLPQRCGFDGENAANFQICGKVSNISDLTPDAEGICTAWSLFPSSNQTIANLARASGQREGSIVEHATTAVAILTLPTRSGSFVGEETIFSVVSRFNHTLLIRTA